MRSKEARQGIRAADYLSGSVCSEGARLSVISPLAIALMSVRHDGSVVFGPVGGTVQKRAASALSACHSDGVRMSDSRISDVFMRTPSGLHVGRQCRRLLRQPLRRRHHRQQQ